MYPAESSDIVGHLCPFNLDAADSHSLSFGNNDSSTNRKCHFRPSSNSAVVAQDCRSGTFDHTYGELSTVVGCYDDVSPASFSDNSLGDVDYVPGSTDESESDVDSDISERIPFITTKLANNGAKCQNQLTLLCPATKPDKFTILNDPLVDSDNVPASIERSEAVSEIQIPNREVSVVSIATRNECHKKKIARPCPFCGKFQTNLTRHMTVVHKNEDVSASVLPYADRCKFFANLRKQGILKHNQNEMKSQKAEYVRERQGKANSSLVTCSQCNGLYAKSYFRRHRAKCIGDLSSTPQALPVNLMTVDDTIAKEFRMEILARFNNDLAGNLCRAVSVSSCLTAHQHKIGYLVPL